MTSKKYIIMLTCMLVLPCYSANNAQWWKQYAKQALGLSIGGAVGAALASRWQQNRYFGALCGAGLWLTGAHLLSRLYKQYRYRSMRIEKTPDVTTPQGPPAQHEQGSSHQKSTSSSSSEQNLNIAPQQEVKEQLSAESEPEQEQPPVPAPVSTSLQEPASISKAETMQQSSEPEQPHVISQSQAEAYKPTMRILLMRQRPRAIAQFKKYNYAPDTKFKGDTALHIAIRSYHSQFIYWFIERYHQDLDTLLMVKNDVNMTPLFQAITHLEGWNKHVTKYADISEVFVKDPLYQHILHILAHTNEYSPEYQEEISIAINSLKREIGKEKLHQLINELLVKEKKQ